MVIEIQEKINTAFNIFDDNMNNTVDVRLLIFMKSILKLYLYGHIKYD